MDGTNITPTVLSCTGSQTGEQGKMDGHWQNEILSRCEYNYDQQSLAMPLSRYLLKISEACNV